MFEPYPHDQQKKEARNKKDSRARWIPASWTWRRRARRNRCCCDHTATRPHTFLAGNHPKMDTVFRFGKWLQMCPRYIHTTNIFMREVMLQLPKHQTWYPIPNGLTVRQAELYQLFEKHSFPKKTGQISNGGASWAGRGCRNIVETGSPRELGMWAQIGCMMCFCFFWFLEWLLRVSVIFVVRHVNTWISSHDFRGSCPAWRWRRWRIWLQLSSQHQACCFLPLSPSYITAGVVLGWTGVAQSGSVDVSSTLWSSRQWENRAQAIMTPWCTDILIVLDLEHLLSLNPGPSLCCLASLGSAEKAVASCCTSFHPCNP